MKFLIRWAALVSIAVAAALLPRTVSAADYPDRPIRLIVAYPAGGGVDVMARLLASALGERLKQSVVVENKPGASGIIGTEYVARATPDGYTLIFAPADTHSINPHVYTNIRYDAQRDFAPIALLGSLPMTLVVNPSLPVKTVDEWVAYVKARPGKISFGSWGVGSSSHVAMETLMLASSLQMLHVPFTGAAPAINAVIAGQVDTMMVTLPTSEPYHQAGKVRIIGVTPIERPKGSVTYPTGGLPAYLAAWVGVLGPADTPPVVVTALNRAIKAVMEDAQVRAGLATVGLDPVAAVGSPAEFGKFLATQSDLWGKTVREAKISVELK
jgi:tripartite-type tricarboxylate transporter receptor subunit TctC